LKLFRLKTSGITGTDGCEQKDKNESAGFRCNDNIKTENLKKYFKGYLCRIDHFKQII